MAGLALNMTNEVAEIDQIGLRFTMQCSAHQKEGNSAIINRLDFCLLLQHYPKREPNMFLVVSFLIVCCQLIFQFLSAVLLIKAPNENKQNTSKQVKF